MNSLTINLENDHEYIIRLTDVMERIIGQDNPDNNDIETVICLIKNFTDGFHHEKEEKLLFPMLERKGFPRSKPPVSTVLMEHEQGRKYVKEMESAFERIKNGDYEGKKSLYSNMQFYITLLLKHIEKENQILYRMADNMLTNLDHQVLLKNFLKVEKSNLCGRLISSYKISIIELEKKYLSYKQSN